MEKDESIEFLKKNLRIVLELDWEGNLQIEVRLCDELVCYDDANLSTYFAQKYHDHR